MKLLSWLRPILIAIASVVLFKHRLQDITSTALELASSHPTLHHIHNQFSSLLFKSPPPPHPHHQPADKKEEQLLHINIPGFAPQQRLVANSMSVPRTIRKVLLAAEQSEGVGARVRRSIGTPSLRNLSPFLMLDHFSIKPGAGFPDHPHRGQETITYLLQGGVDHEDFAGNRGTLSAGDLQFMTAGRGIVHAEMPRQNPDGSANVGLQLWVDLPEHLKACEPRYRDLRAAEIPSVDVDDGRATIKVISGQSHGVDSVKDLAYTPVWILDMALRPGAKVTQPLPAGWTAFAYLLEGDVWFGQGEDRTKVHQYHNTVFNADGDVVHVENDADAEHDARLVVVAGTPLDQPIIQYGPFVLTSANDVRKAFVDYQTHSNGFERAEGWESEIGKSMVH
jgi:redox-sensitive bicupin YhaK (pirin superfamily)